MATNKASGLLESLVCSGQLTREQADALTKSISRTCRRLHIEMPVALVDDFHLPRQLSKDGVHVSASSRAVYGFIENDIIDVADKQLLPLTEADLDKLSRQFESCLGAANEAWPETVRDLVEDIRKPLDCPTCKKGNLVIDEETETAGDVNWGEPVDAVCDFCEAKFTLSFENGNPTIEPRKAEVLDGPVAEALEYVNSRSS